MRRSIVEIGLLMVSVLAISTGLGYLIKCKPAAATDDKETEKGYSLTTSGKVGGLWVQSDTVGPYAALYSTNDGPGEKKSILGFNRNQINPGDDFAIVATRKGVYIQVKDDKGEFHFIPVTALLKLEDKEIKEKEVGMAYPIK